MGGRGTFRTVLTCPPWVYLRPRSPSHPHGGSLPRNHRDDGGEIDHKQEYKTLNRGSAAEVSVIEVPTFRYLMLDASSDPNTVTEHADAIEM